MLAALLAALTLTSAAPAIKTVTDADNGKTVTISKHQGLHIDLDECGDCGYSWRTTGKPSRKVLTTRPDTTKDPDCPPADPGQPACAGGGYTKVFRYTAKATGRTRIRLEYFGPGKSKSSDSFRITVRVR